MFPRPQGGKGIPVLRRQAWLLGWGESQRLASRPRSQLVGGQRRGRRLQWEPPPPLPPLPTSHLGGARDPGSPRRPGGSEARHWRACGETQGAGLRSVGIG